MKSIDKLAATGTSKGVSRRTVLKGATAMAGAVGLGATIAPVDGSAALQTDDRGTLIMRARSFPATFNPLLSDARVWLYDGLIRFDPDMNAIPDLAESWEISADGLLYTFKLRQDVVFHDGTPMTADDVIYTAQLTLDESVASAYRSKFIIDGKPVVWAKVDDYTVTVTLPVPSSSFLAKLSRADEIFFCILPKHILEKETDMATAAFNQNPIGTGAFKFVEYRADESLTLASHDAYHQGKPGVAKLIRLAYPNEQSSLAALKAGELDIATLSEAGNVAAADGDNTLTVYRYNSNWIFAGRFNFGNTALQDPAVRQAIAHAIDRTNLVNAVISPTAVAGNSPVSYGWAASPNVTVYDYDADKAASLLDAAGWAGSPVRSKDGTELSFKLTIDKDYGAPDLAAGIQALLDQVGIKIEIELLETATLETQVFQNRDFDIYLGWQGFGVDPDIASRWLTVSETTEGTYLDNPSNYSNAAVDEALKSAAIALTQDDRAKFLWQAQDLITADCPAVWLQEWEAISAVSANVGGVSLPPSTADMDNTGIFREPWMLTSTRKS